MRLRAPRPPTPLLARYGLALLATVAGVVTGLVLAATLLRQEVRLSIPEPVTVTLDGQPLAVGQALTLTALPGDASSYTFQVSNSSGRTYGIQYRATVTEGAWSDLNVMLDVDLEGTDCSSDQHAETGGGKQSVSLTANLGPGGQHCLVLTVRPSASAAPTERVITLYIDRLSPF